MHLDTRSPRTTVAAAAAVAMLLTLTVGPPAQAADHFDEVADLISRVGPDQGTVVPATALPGGDLTAVASGVHATIPTDPSAELLLSKPADVAMPQLAVNLPAELNLSKGGVARDGTVVYKGKGKGKGVDAAVQVLDDGSMRVQTIIRNAKAAHSFTYTFGDDVKVAEGSNGEVALVTDTADGGVAIAEVGAAWAVDANGAPVATRYEVQANSLVQVIGADASTAYPVTADPRWKWFAAAWSAKFNKPETRDFANAGSAIAMCGVFGKYGLPALGFCAFYAGYINAQANIARGAGQCIAITVTPPPLVYRYNDRDCFGSY
ncbi:hypothetical protein [Cellulomonas fimi]|uniref:Uncharacterized protein n=1 Tax=Cellulomonas fimi TaxID=1708 RepID=A0A7Y0LZZ9_CELFI|nr:hypothetical protein [Cellulomonas fimi]NMR21066.1 hypothetical protein [Cellulomonas fimi]